MGLEFDDVISIGIIFNINFVSFNFGDIVFYYEIGMEVYGWSICVCYCFIIMVML